MRPGRPETWPPRISSTCSTAWGSRPASTSISSGRPAKSQQLSLDMISLVRCTKLESGRCDNNRERTQGMGPLTALVLATPIFGFALQAPAVEALPSSIAPSAQLAAAEDMVDGAALSEAVASGLA